MSNESERWLLILKYHHSYKKISLTLYFNIVSLPSKDPFIKSNSTVKENLN